MRRYAAECFGTFVLVFAGCGSAVLAGPQLGALGVALAFGLTLLAMVYAVGRTPAAISIPPPRSDCS